MATLPAAVTSPTVDAIYRSYEARREPPRGHLGASVIGRPCSRQLWYGFRWAYAEQHSGRLLRLFERGQREEPALSADLRAIGVQLHTVDPRTGRQFEFSAVGGHVGGSMDGAGAGFPEAPKAWHVVEYKTFSGKTWADLSAKGVQASKPEHYAQVVLYMKWSGMERAMYLGVNKDTDDIYAERIRFDKTEAERLEAKAARIVESPVPLTGISADPAWYQCKICPAANLCHRSEGVQVNCRTCVHATPEMDGNGRWSCARHKRDIGTDEQRKGCAEHRLIPDLIAWAKATSADEAENWIEYTLPDGGTFRNGGDAGWTSAELVLGPKIAALVSDPGFMALKGEFGAVAVKADGPAWMRPGIGRVA